ncbi:cytochrome P450 [Ramaria rubella]|nr:cytochrome P450 [Ramaria rubella]
MTESKYLVGRRLPPGPCGLPIIGNVLDIPPLHQWETFSHWEKQYGDLVYIKVLGVPMIIVNSMEVAHDLFEKRSSVYSGRYQFPMLTLLDVAWNWGIMDYGSRWRLHRKAFMRNFHPTAVKEYYPIQTKWIRNLLSSLKESPEDFESHLRHHVGAVIMDVVYGIQVLAKDDPYLHTAEDAMAAFSEAATPGSFLVDLLPMLKYVPEWLPGAGFQKKLKIWKVTFTNLVDLPFYSVKRTLVSREGPPTEPSIIARMFAEYSRDGSVPSREEEDIMRATGAVAYGAGSDTTNIALTWFVMAMVLYPEVQRKAQAELDNVLGTDRLPSFEDEERLPYINALCKEIQRWNPVAPLSIPHATSQDDVYKGYWIPGGSVVIPNTWAMLHDERIFGPRPAEFEPERFLRPGARDPNVAFGHGRRMCPGRYMATSSIFITVASILKVFNITHAKDDVGNVIPVEPICTDGIVTHPERFCCAITPRSLAAESLLASL